MSQLSESFSCLQIIETRFKKLVMRIHRSNNQLVIDVK